jgi:hypothetical protein
MRLLLVWVWIVSTTLMTGCGGTALPPPTRLVPTRMPTLAPSPTAAAEHSDSGWIVAASGVEVRTFTTGEDCIGPARSDLRSAPGSGHDPAAHPICS